MRRKINNQETWQIYGIDGELVAEYGANSAVGMPQKEYGYRDGQLLVTAEASTAAAPTSGLVAHWKFDENTGTTTADSSGNGHTGTLTNGPAWTTGQTNAALSFDGVNDQVVNNGIANLTNNFTISFWAQPTTTHEIDSENTTGIGGTSGQRYALWPLWHTNGHAGAGVSVGTNGVSVYESSDYYMPATLVYSGTLSGWTHIAVVYENKQPKLYINGSLVCTGLTSPKSFVHINPLEIGGDVYGYYSGKLDEIRVYNRVLSAAEVATLPNGTGSSAKVRWLVADHLGTPRIILDQTGAAGSVKRHDYLPFGEELFAGAGGRTAAMGYAPGDGVRQQFTQKERDVETGLDYFLARYYSSTQGRFSSPDEFSGGPREVSVLGSGNATKQALPYAEITNPQSINKYQYVYNNPLRFIDPDGHQQDDKKGLVDQLLEYLGRILKGENQQDGMLPTSGDGEVRKREQNGPLDADPNRLTLNSWKVRGQQAQAYADVYEMADPTGLASFSRGWMEGDPNKMIGGVLQGVIKIRGTNIAFSEAKTLVGGWSRGTFAKVSETLDYHFAKHGFEVGAENLVQYMRKAAAFGSNLRGAQRTQLENGATRYLKNGYYIIKDQAGKILSFGKAI